MKTLKIYDSYLINTNGEITSLKYGKERKLKPAISKGYYRITFCNKNKTKRYLIHRLVANCFLQNSENKPCVNHIDGNKLNNHIDNLEWCTYSENEKHSYDKLGKINNRRKFSECEILEIRNTAIKGQLFVKGSGNIKFVANKYSVGIKTIHNILNRECYGAV